MAILIDKIRVAGFRGIRDVELDLPRVAVLIGLNNAGKTSVVKAFQLALGDYSRHLTEEDFFIGHDDNPVGEILIDIRIIPIDEHDNRASLFEEEWIDFFGDKIQVDPLENQFSAIRTICTPDLIKGGFNVSRYSLERWSDFTDWRTVKVNQKKKIRSALQSIPYFSIDAQRDLHTELREKNSFVGKILSNIKYNESDKNALEGIISDLNNEAVNKSEPLLKLKEHLEQLNQSFVNSGKAEITPFPKKIRDLSKQFTVHFGENESNLFSMEYHGMGTRSWASMLTVKAFTELTSEKFSAEEEAYHPVLAAEEPEAHLHPNAQRTLYKQLVESKGQVIITTHSSYVVALADQSELRALSNEELGVCVRQLSHDISLEDKRKLQREVIHSRGELLFSRAIILSEGETEEQALPILFQKYFNEDPFSLGINFIGVGGSGAKYRPFLRLARDFNIPVFIFSDGEEPIIKKLKSAYEEFFGVVDLANSSNITILEGTDFEGYLLSSGYEELIKNTIIVQEGATKIASWISKRQGTALKPVRTGAPDCVTCKQPILESTIRDYSSENGTQKAILEILDSKKPMYAQAVAQELCKLTKEQLPPKIIEFFEKIRARI
ncbi:MULTISPECIES: ATP-dependent endonuclease [unclassified Colwellia]|uniref:ATP-dependent nuclease n=1 Tax=unclassified Colwellia TaxID=196834 RepID=UPI0015F78091|nr:MULTISPECIES: AAA family ATPase [unclassified Colwellia]MBA6380525.1 AAA family ATPase [Colwellia sp. BRX10-7]MBA6388052.1 AAA family ATPase [Colwellia sp. BRX10-2]MBA6403047.1 AAA family ATPase [Colwellia sp. BRX10-5]MBA6405972.1 AAA family ATPase [Colwellia sp. BRX10-1]